MIFTQNYQNLLDVLFAISPSFYQNLNLMLKSIPKAEREKLAQQNCVGSLYFDNYKNCSYKFIGEGDFGDSIFLKVVKGELASTNFEFSLAKITQNSLENFVIGKKEQLPLCQLSIENRFGDKNFNFTLCKNGNKFHIMYCTKPYSENGQSVSKHVIDITNLRDITDLQK